MRRGSGRRTELAAVAREILGLGAALRIRVHGRSMAPFVQDGDILTIRPVSAGAPRRGDIALYVEPCGGLRAHCVVKTRCADGRVHIVTRGYASGGDSELVWPEQILGVAEFMERSGRKTRLSAGPQRVKGLAWIGLQIARARCRPRR